MNKYYSFYIINIKLKLINYEYDEWTWLVNVFNFFFNLKCNSRKLTLNEESIRIVNWYKYIFIV